MLVATATDFFLPTGLYLFFLLAFLCVQAFRRRNRRLRRYRYLALAATLWSYVLSTPAIDDKIIASVERAYPPIDDPQPAEDSLVVVLSSGATIRSKTPGERKWDTRLDAAAWERTQAGIALWRKVGGKILFVGGPTPDQRGSVAGAMGDIARSCDVPGASVEVENYSRNTHQNLEFNRERIVNNKGPVWLVTSAVHMKRAMAVAEALGLHLKPYPCDFRADGTVHWWAWLPNSGGAASLTDALHEIVGLAYYRLRGRAE